MILTRNLYPLDDSHIDEIHAPAGKLLKRKNEQMEIKGKVHCFFEQSGTFKNPKIRIGTGKPEWGAEPGKMYFVISWEA